MKKNILSIIPALFLLFSCSNDDAFPKVENITKGQKWTLKIGSSPSDVYQQLQELSAEKHFYTVGLVYKKPYAKPEDIKSDIALYNAITLETSSGVLERVVINFDQNKVSSIEKGGGLLNPIQKWPESQSNSISINVNDPLDTIMEKLKAIYQIANYQEYKIVFPDKWLAKSYDADMKNYEEWAFSFSEDISSSRSGRNSVRLYFKNNKLAQIRNEYEEFDFVN